MIQVEEELKNGLVNENWMKKDSKIESLKGNQFVVAAVIVEESYCLCLGQQCTSSEVFLSSDCKYLLQTYPEWNPIELVVIRRSQGNSCLYCHAVSATEMGHAQLSGYSARKNCYYSRENSLCVLAHIPNGACSSTQLLQAFRSLIVGILHRSGSVRPHPNPCNPQKVWCL